MSTNRRIISIFLKESLAEKSRLIKVSILIPLAFALNDLALPLIVSLTVNRLVQAYATQQQDYWPLFWPYIGVFIATALISRQMMTTGLHNISQLEVATRHRLDTKVFNKLLAHSMHFHANSFSGALVSRASRFSAGYIILTDAFFLNIVNLFIRAFVSFIVIAFFVPVISLAMFLWTVFFIYINIILTRRRMAATKRATEAETVQTSHLADSIGNIGTIKAFGQQAFEALAYGKKSQHRADTKEAAWRVATNNMRNTAHLMFFLQLITLVLSIHAVMHHWIALGTLLLIQVYQAQLMAGLWNIGNISRNIEQALSDSVEMADILDQEIDVKDPDKPLKAHITKGAITFKDVRFAHGDKKDKKALFEHFNLAIKPGEKIGLVGRSGSGKTTLTRLLLRFSDIDAGTITIDGQDITTLQQDDLRHHISYVPQEPLLFHRTLRENIAYGRTQTTPSEKEITTAAKQAHALEFINQLPEGLDTLVGERGIKLSGGQRQRIALARAMLKDAPVLLLDEATSALDSESEKLIQDALWKLIEGRTAIIIAHRLSTIQKMDRIIVMDDGKIIEQGTHKQLLAAKGMYAELWAHQSGGFIG